MKRIVSLWLPNWPTDRLNRRRPTPVETPVVTIEETGGRAMVVAVDAVAAVGGVLPGLSLADARALLPDLTAFTADPAGDAAALGRLADWCSRYTPLVAVEGRDGLWLDITGCGHLFGGEAALIADLRHRLGRLGYRSLAGAADTPGAAWAAARFHAAPVEILPPGTARAELGELPVAALRLPAAMAGELERLGLRRIADLYPLPRAALTRRFGLLPGERLDQALGRCEEPISPRLPAPCHLARQVLAEPILDAEAIAALLQRLLARLCPELAKAGQGVRRLELLCYRVDGRLIRLAVGTSQPTRDERALARLFAERLERIDPGFGIEAVALAASAVEPLSELQLVLRRSPAAGADLAPLLAPFLDRLGNRLGFQRLTRAVPQESHLPERAVLRQPADAAARPPAAWPAGAGGELPLRLLPRPEPVAAAGEPDQGGPPREFFWQSRRHRIRQAEGPARIAPEWWRAEGGAVRDYWRLEDEEGRRFWLYGQDGGWYLHGLFA
jgi:protein ImuB